MKVKQTIERCEGKSYNIDAGFDCCVWAENVTVQRVSELLSEKYRGQRGEDFIDLFYRTRISDGKENCKDTKRQGIFCVSLRHGKVCHAGGIHGP